jgi:hypothetical protein
MLRCPLGLLLFKAAMPCCVYLCKAMQTTEHANALLVSIANCTNTCVNMISAANDKRIAD